MNQRHTAEELNALPTLGVGQADDLKIDDGNGRRVWLSRCGKEDGEPFDNAITVEQFDGDRWVTVEVYPG